MFFGLLTNTKDILKKRESDSFFSIVVIYTGCNHSETTRKHKVIRYKYT